MFKEIEVDNHFQIWFSAITKNIHTCFLHPQPFIWVNRTMKPWRYLVLYLHEHTGAAGRESPIRDFSTSIFDSEQLVQNCYENLLRILVEIMWKHFSREPFKKCVRSKLPIFEHTAPALFFFVCSFKLPPSLVSIKQFLPPPPSPPPPP